MPTYAQLQAEPWWGREVTTPAMDWLGDELCRRAGRPRTAFGTKGDRHHLRGAHRSQEWLQRSVYCTNRTYTVQAGLTADQLRHVAGADFTPGEWGTAANRALMVEQTRRLVAAMRAGQLPGVREVIGTLDGRTVVGTRPDGSTFSSDSSHLEHWHLTIDRRRCADRTLMERVLAVALGDTEDDMTPAEKWTLHVMNWRLEAIKANRATIKVPARADLAGDVEQAKTGFEEPNLLAVAVARESSSPDEVRALLATLPAPASVDVDQLVTAVAERVVATLPAGGAVSREDLEAALRSVLGSVDNVGPAS